MLQSGTHMLLVLIYTSLSNLTLVLLSHIHVGGGAASWVSEYGGCVVASF